MPLVATTGLSVLLLPACGDSGSDSGGVGSACTENVACNLELCYSESPFTGGYCTADCAADPSICPTGSACTQILGKSLCLDRCAADGECREGYVCDYGVCRPPCTGLDQCQTGDRCREGRCQAPCKSDGECTPNRCQDGDCVPPCQKDTDCLPGQSCDTATGGCKALPGKQMGEPCSEAGPAPNAPRSGACRRARSAR